MFPMSWISALSRTLSVFVIASATTVSAIVCLFLAHPTEVPCEGRGIGLFGGINRRQIRGGLSLSDIVVVVLCVTFLLLSLLENGYCIICDICVAVVRTQWLFSCV